VIWFVTGIAGLLTGASTINFLAAACWRERLVGIAGLVAGALLFALAAVMR